MYDLGIESTLKLIAWGEYTAAIYSALHSPAIMVAVLLLVVAVVAPRTT